MAQPGAAENPETQEILHMDGESFEALVKEQPNLDSPIAVYDVTGYKIQLCPPKQASRSFRFLKMECSGVLFRNLHIRGRLVLSGKGEYIFQECHFEDYGQNQDDPTLQTIEYSSLTFEKCTFSGAGKAAIAIRGRSRMLMKGCLFNGVKNGVLISEGTICVLDSCDFRDTAMLSVYSYQNSRALCRNCSFVNCGGRAMMAIGNSTIAAQNCRFEGMKSGAVFAAEKSECVVDMCTFSDCSFFGVGVMSRSHGFVAGSQFHGMNGNAIQIGHSDGLIINILVERCRCPAIFVTGQRSNPVIKDCTLRFCAVGVAAREFSVPVVFNVAFQGMEREALSISDFSGPLISQCSFEGISGNCFTVFNGAKAMLVDIPEEVTVDEITEGKVVRGFDGTFLPPKVVQRPLRFAEDQWLASEFPVPDYRGLQRLPRLQVQSSVHRPHVTNGGKCVSCGCLTNSISSSCGHRLCPECAEQKAKVTGVCPLCHTAFQGTSTVFEQAVCCVCRESEATWLLIPCGHLCLCAACAVQLSRYQNQCPLCYTKIRAQKPDFS